MITRYPIFHDRQSVSVTGPVTTTSLTFVLIPGVTLTTRDLGTVGDYIAFLSLSLQHTQNNSTVTFRATIAGVQGAERVVEFGPNSANNPRGRTFISHGDDVAAGSLIILEWKTSGGTATIDGIRFVMDGVPENRTI